MGGEAVERRELKRRFGALVDNWVALVRRQTRLTGFISGYGHVSTAFPILIVTPAYLAGAIPLGVLMQAALAFQRVEGAFAFCLSSYSKIAEWKAVMDRLSQFEAAMGLVDRPGLPGAAIRRREPSPTAGCRFAISCCGSPDGEPIARGARARRRAGRAAAGHRAVGLRQVVPAARARRHLAARRGGDRCGLPQDARMLALPQRRYFPLGTLRQALTYPTPARIGRRRRHPRGDGGGGHRRISPPGSTRRPTGAPCCRAASSSASALRAC